MLIKTQDMALEKKKDPLEEKMELHFNRKQNKRLL